MNHRATRVLAAAAAGAALLATAGCSSSSSDASKSAPASSAQPSTSSAAGTAAGTSAALAVVTSTDVYGDIVSTIGGDRVTVTAFISDPDQDPHSYESSARNQLAVKNARLIVENGGGYDDFVDRLVSSTSSTAVVLNAVDLSGKKAAAGDALNEHVWYDFPTVKIVTGKVVDALSAADPGSAALFQANGVAFSTKLNALIAREAKTKATHAGNGVAITEPVPLYLLQAEGLLNKTPADFSEAIEEGDDVSPTVLRDTLALFTAKQVKALVYNEQTSGPTTEQVKKAATDNGIAVVPVTETLPAGKDYLTWMSDTLDAMDKALGNS